MKLAVVGVGNAGSRIANQILDVEQSSGRNLADGNTLLINATEPSFDTTERVPTEHRLVIGDVHRRLDGHGTDGDADLGAEVAQEERNEIIRAFDLIEFHEVDGVLVAAGLAGGIGGGAGAVVIDQLTDICDEPVYGICALPAESEGQTAALTAARSLQSFVQRADNVLPFDNNAWIDGTEAELEFAEANRALATRVVTLFAAGEFDGATTPENRMDPSDIMRTLETGGVSSIGYASTTVPPNDWFRSWLAACYERLPWTPDPDAQQPTDAAKINQLVRRAANSTLTVPCDIKSADRALIALSGPSRALSRKGFESGRYWLEEEADIVEVMAGDEPHDRSSTLTATVLFSNVTQVPPIEAMQAQAVDGTLKTAPDRGMQFENISQ